MNKDQIMQQIDDLVASKTFSLDALEGIKKIKDAMTQAIMERDEYKKQGDSLHTKLTEEITTNTQLKEQLAAAKIKTESLEVELKAAAAAIWEKQIAEASADAYKDALHTVFKPHAVRETIMRNHAVAVPVANGSGYLQTVQNTDNVIREDV